MDIVSFMINRVIFLLIGLITGIIVGFIVSAYFSFVVDESDKKGYIIKGTLLLTPIIAVIFCLLELFAEFSVISYVDLTVFVILIGFLVLIGIFTFTVSKVFLPGFPDGIIELEDKIGTIVCIGMVVFFAGIFSFIMFVEIIIGLILVIFFAAIILLIIITIVTLILQEEIRIRAFSGIRHRGSVFISMFVIVLLLIGVLSYFVVYYANYSAPIHQAEYFDSFIGTRTDDLFQNEIPDDMIRLVNVDLAKTLVEKHASVFGSNVRAKSLHITTYQGRLVWVAAMAPDNYFNQRLSGLLVIDANDLAREPMKIELNNVTVSENLFYSADTSRAAWLSDPLLSYGRAYITWVGDNFSHAKMKSGQIVQIQTYNSPGFDLVTRYGGCKVYDLQGQLLETYSTRDALPEWIAQPFDEYWLESNIANWGSLRSGEGFDIFAGGFLGITTPSKERLVISEDTRYIINPDSNQTVAITPVHPAASPLANAGIFLTTAEGIIFFDYRQRSYISSEAAKQYVESQEPPASQGEYYATLPMLYPTIIENQTRMAWFSPLYHRVSSYNEYDELVSYNVQFRALYILDAENQDINGRAYFSGASGSTKDMIATAKAQYKESVLSQYSGTTNQTNQTETYIVANITQKASYVEDGNTFIVLRTNLTDYQILIATTKDLSADDWIFVLMEVEVGTIVEFKANFLDGSSSTWQLTEIGPV